MFTIIILRRHFDQTITLHLFDFRSARLKIQSDHFRVAVSVIQCKFYSIWTQMGTKVSDWSARVLKLAHSTALVSWKYFQAPHLLHTVDRIIQIPAKW